MVIAICFLASAPAIGQSDSSGKFKRPRFSLEALMYLTPKVKEKADNITSLHTNNTISWGSNALFHSYINDKWILIAGLGFTSMCYKYDLELYSAALKYNNKVIAYRVIVGAKYINKKVSVAGGNLFGRALFHPETRHLYKSMGKTEGVFPDGNDFLDTQWWYLYGSVTAGWTGCKDRLLVGLTFFLGGNIQPEGGQLNYRETTYTSNSFPSLMVGYKF